MADIIPTRPVPFLGVVGTSDHPSPYRLKKVREEAAALASLEREEERRKARLELMRAGR